jgi:hypothetical protein
MGDQKTVRFHYRKAAFYRVMHIDGVVGGITPHGDLFLSLFNERLPLPDSVEQEIFPDGKLGPVVRSETKSHGGIVREMETGIIIDQNTARALVDFLSDQLKTIDKFKKEDTKEKESR